MKKHDPLRGDALAPEAPGAELQALFDGARADGFSGTETDELWSRVGAALAAPGAAASRGASGAGASTAGGAGVAVKIAAALLVGGAVAAGVAYREMAPRPSPVITVHTAPVEVDPSPTGAQTGVQTGAIDPAPAVAIDDLPRASDPAPTGPAALVAPRTRATERRDTSRSAASRPAETAEPSALAQLGQDTAPASGAPATARTSVATSARPSDAPSDDHGATAPAAAPDPGPTEGALLLRARQELASDPSGALTLTQEHARRFPSGALVQEREVLAIEALARLGRSSDAKHRLDAFRARFPRSPHIERLTTLLDQ